MIKARGKQRQANQPHAEVRPPFPLFTSRGAFCFSYHYLLSNPAYQFTHPLGAWHPWGLNARPRNEHNTHDGMVGGDRGGQRVVSE